MQKIPVSLIHHCTGLLLGPSLLLFSPGAETQSYAWHTGGVGLPWAFAGRVCVWEWKSAREGIYAQVLRGAPQY